MTNNMFLEKAITEDKAVAILSFLGFQVHEGKHLHLIAVKSEDAIKAKKQLKLVHNLLAEPRLIHIDIDGNVDKDEDANPNFIAGVSEVENSK